MRNKKLDKQMIEEIIDVFENRLTDDVYERYIDDVEIYLKKGYSSVVISEKIKFFIKKDIERFEKIISTLGGKIDVDLWYKMACEWIENITHK